PLDQNLERDKKLRALHAPAGAPPASEAKPAAAEAPKAAEVQPVAAKTEAKTTETPKS
ncbi:MAG: hypothetical protein HY901_37645, partial [Deltaproteobacteria bacterium]|nr:hypothetical protein [Deltaproteobacteria bacterium]